MQQLDIFATVVGLTLRLLNAGSVRLHTWMKIGACHQGRGKLSR
jgi:hypothetical protein